MCFYTWRTAEGSSPATGPARPPLTNLPFPHEISSSVPPRLADGGGSPASHVRFFRRLLWFHVFRLARRVNFGACCCRGERFCCRFPSLVSAICLYLSERFGSDFPGWFWHFAGCDRFMPTSCCATLSPLAAANVCCLFTGCVDNIN